MSSQTSSEKKKCLFCPMEYLHQHHCNRHMKASHGYNASVIREKERIERVHLLEEEKRKKIEERETAKKRKLEEADTLRQAKRKEKEEKKRKWAEARNKVAVSFDFNRDILGNAIYCGKCNKSFTSIEERNKHEARHDDPKNFVCGNCDKRFKKMENKDFHEVKCGVKATSESRNVVDDDDEEDEDGFSVQRSALSGIAKIYRLSFAKGIRNLFPRLEKAMKEASDQLFTIQRNNENVKYYISLRCLYYKPTDPDVVTDPPVVFNSGTSLLLAGSNVEEQMKINYDNLKHSVEDYETNGSGWSLLNLASLDINTIQYRGF